MKSIELTPQEIRLLRSLISTWLFGASVDEDNQDFLTIESKLDQAEYELRNEMEEAK